MYHALVYYPDVQETTDLDKQRCEEAWREAEALRLDFPCVLDRLHLVKITEDLSRIVWSSELPLGGGSAA